MSSGFKRGIHLHYEMRNVEMSALRAQQNVNLVLSAGMGAQIDAEIRFFIGADNGARKRTFVLI